MGVFWRINAEVHTRRCLARFMMKFEFPYSKLRVVLLGVGLGFVARFIFGGPEKSVENDRRFNQPINATVLEEVDDAPDFPLEPPPQSQ